MRATSNRAHNETLPIAAMRVSNPDCSPLRINGRDVTVAPTGFLEIVGDDFPGTSCGMFYLEPIADAERINSRPHQGPHHHGNPKLPIKMILLKWWKRRNRSPRSKWPSLKRLKGRRPEAEFIIGARCIGIRAIEGGVKPPRIPIRGTELACPLICAIAVEAAKTHTTTQQRRTTSLRFIAL